MAETPEGYTLQADGTYQSHYSGTIYTAEQLGLLNYTTNTPSGLPLGTPNDLEGLFPWLAEIPNISRQITQWLTEGLNPQLIPLKVRDTMEYKWRFPGMTVRTANKLNPISEAEYLSLERAYYQQLHSFGLTAYADPTAFGQFAGMLIGKDISVSELNSRLDLAFATVFDTGQQVKDAFQAYYGVTLSDIDLASYFLDPDKGLAEIEDKVLTAQVGGEALRFGLTVSRNRADELRRAGITPELAKAGFADVASEMPQLSRLASIHAFSPLSQTQLEDFFFHEDPTVGKSRAQIFTRALAEFQGSVTGRRTAQGGLAELLATDQTF